MRNCSTSEQRNRQTRKMCWLHKYLLASGSSTEFRIKAQKNARFNDVCCWFGCVKWTYKNEEKNSASATTETRMKEKHVHRIGRQGTLLRLLFLS